MNRTVVSFLAAAFVAVFTCAAQAQDNVFFGNLHSHTSLSDGSSTPDKAYQHAKSAGLDFLAITEHNHSQAGRIANTPSLYNGTSSSSLISRARQFNRDGQFVAIFGQEFSTISSGNHMNVFEVPNVINVASGRFDQLINTWMPANRDSTNQLAIIQLNHPAQSDSPNDKEYGRDDFTSASAWISAVDNVARLINIMNGPSHTEGTGHRPGTPSESEFKRYLSLGLHIGPTADQDNHKQNWGDATDGRTGVITQSLTKANILTALRERHVYATEDKNLKVVARINNQLIGSLIRGSNVPAVNANLTISVSLSDADEPGATYTVQVFSGKIGGAVAEAVRTQTREGNGSVSIPNVKYTGGRQYVYLKIIQRNDDDEQDRVWTAPVWFEPGADSAPPPPLGPDSPPPPDEPTSPVGLTLSVDRAGEEATITNTGATPISLAGWILRSVRGDQRFTIPAGTTIAAGATLVVRSGSNAVGAVPGTLIWTTGFVWNNDDDPAELIDPMMNVVAEDDE